MKRHSVLIGLGVAATISAGAYLENMLQINIPKVRSPQTSRPAVPRSPAPKYVVSLADARNTSRDSADSFSKQLREYLSSPHSDPKREYSFGPFGILSGNVDPANLPHGESIDKELSESAMTAMRRDWRGPYSSQVKFEPTLILPSTGNSLEEKLQTEISKRTDLTPVYLEALNGEKPNADNYGEFFTSLLNAHFTGSDNYKEIMPLLSLHSNLLHIVFGIFLVDEKGTLYRGGIPNPLTNGVDDKLREHYSRLLATLPNKFVLPSIAGIKGPANFTAGIRNMAVEHTQPGRVDNFPYINGQAVIMMY